MKGDNIQELIFFFEICVEEVETDLARHHNKGGGKPVRAEHLIIIHISITSNPKKSCWLVIQPKLAQTLIAVDSMASLLEQYIQGDLLSSPSPSPHCPTPPHKLTAQSSHSILN